ncbi:Methyltransferase domain-containing protein [Nocardioides scoriae]|uniref:Methyltransferase domain-containing protein n=1 Tax=Nocardioides scoriae TaxID=642780 RepID=A0A1H1UDK4_9ACTN|nr:class I SAM-dependent methyltransferase [Nocardioides scoriae]SDS70594.1 Methyltransferase domain-containing protein [Nocardioides scoriae]
MSESSPTPAASFGSVADAYDRARPSYPDAAVDWLTGGGRSHVLELGAGTGKLTEVLHRRGHHVLATDPLPPMLQLLGRRVPAPHVAAAAEHLPVRSRSVDAVVCGQSFHWFDHDRALLEAARVLRPGGVIALAWNGLDTSIPWVKRLDRLISPQADPALARPDARTAERADPLMGTPYFGFVDTASFRIWATHTRATLLDLARSVSHVATMSPTARDRVLAQVGALYDDYGRGHDGMQVPYVTRCYRAVVRHQELPPEETARPEQPPRPQRSGADIPPPGLEDDGEPTGPITREPPEDPGMQLIDFR